MVQKVSQQIEQKAVSNGNLRFWTRSGESAQSLPVVLARDRCMGGRMLAKSGPNGVVTQAQVAYRGHQRGTFGASQCLPDPRNLGTIHCRHYFSDIIGWLMTIHVHPSLESGRACTYASYAIRSTEYGTWIMEFGIQYGKWDVEHGIFNMDHGVRTVESGEHGVCSMKHGVPIKEYAMEYGGRRMKHGLQSMASGVWSAAKGNGKWSLKYGIQNMEH